MKKMLLVLAHPDDESFSAGGLIAYYAHQGVEIHLICATRGEGGDRRHIALPNAESMDEDSLKKNLGNIRAQELLNAAAILGLHNVDILDYPDGSLCHDIYFELADIIIQKIEAFKPQVILTFDRLGWTGHLDHIAVSMITTFAFLNTTYGNKLYYLANLDTQAKKANPKNDYFVYWPEGYSEKEITTQIDTSSFFATHIAAINQHQSQIDDVKIIINRLENKPKTAYLILQYYRGVSVELPETDIFSGIGI